MIMADMMAFPETVEEFMEQNKITDRKQIYTNGAELVPIFRMKQWFEHKPERKPGKWKKMTAEGMLGAWWYECSVCGVRPLRMRWTNMDELSNYCPNCGARMEGE